VKLTDASAAVTGSASGLGPATAHLLAGMGATAKAPPRALMQPR
jgi:NAD(P)-dependent dehydrogenase (short-subunit alcohol dehydrogenase family)